MTLITPATWTDSREIIVGWIRHTLLLLTKMINVLAQLNATLVRFKLPTKPNVRWKSLTISCCSRDRTVETIMIFTAPWIALLLNNHPIVPDLNTTAYWAPAANMQWA